jgi:hypothetical protein
MSILHHSSLSIHRLKGSSPEARTVALRVIIHALEVSVLIGDRSNRARVIVRVLYEMCAFFRKNWTLDLVEPILLFRIIERLVRQLGDKFLEMTRSVHFPVLKGMRNLFPFFASLVILVIVGKARFLVLLGRCNLNGMCS